MGRLVAVVTAALVAACAHHQGGQATQGALEAFRTEPPEGSHRPAERIGRETTEGMLNQLTSPEGLASVSKVVDAAVTRSLEAALGGYGGPGERRAGRAPSLVDRMARDSAAGFSAGFTEELRLAFGPDGRGPLAESLSATAGEAARSAVRGVGGELGDLFPGCRGEDRQACAEAAVRSLGRAAAAGFVDGIVGSAAWPMAAGLGFLLGVAAILALQGTARILRRRPAQRREAHP
jgi:hypothetical protein